MTLRVAWPSSWRKPAAKDGVVVKVLKAQGAIPFVKTNISQTLLRSLQANPAGAGAGTGAGTKAGPRMKLLLKG